MIFTKTPDYIDGVPIVVDDLSAYATEAYHLYANHIETNRCYAESLLQYRGTRENFMHGLAAAYLHNIDHEQELLHILEANVDIQQLASFKIHPNNGLGGNLKDYLYMKRDWCGLSEGEQQLQLIEEPIRALLQNSNITLDRALFIGAGLGRIAHDFCDSFDEVYATDKSFSMAWHYHQLKKQPIEFYEILNKNIFSIQNGIQKYSTPQIAANQGKILQYFVSDVLQLPLQEASMSAVFSVYFTDVIALRLIFPQIDRVLQDGGLFVHCGPLDYFFDEPSEMLTAEEIVNFFIARGYTPILDQKVRTFHLENTNSITNKVYDNWLFAAIKNEVAAKSKASASLDQQTVLSIRGNVRFTKEISLNNEAETEDSVTLIINEQEQYENAAALLEILRLIDGRRSVHEILDLLHSEFEMPRTEDERILATLKMLVDKGVLVGEH